MSADKQHAVISPSAAERWFNCPGAPLMERDHPEGASAAAEEGTAAHELAAICLTTSSPAVGHIGMLMSNGVEVDEEMARHVQDYVDHVRAFDLEHGGTGLVEVELPIDSITGEAGAAGTADYLHLAGGTLTVMDLKYGHHFVNVLDNKQLLMYALAAYLEYDTLEDIKQVRLVIYQPRVGNIADAIYNVDDLRAVWTDLSTAARKSWRIYAGEEPMVLVAGEAQCRYCKASGSCHEQDAMVERLFGATIADAASAPPLADVDDPRYWGYKMDALAFVSDWCDAVREKVSYRVHNGLPVVGEAGPYKLVQGKKGRRGWKDEIQARNMLTRLCNLPVREIETRELMSPAQVEKLFKSGKHAERFTQKRWDTICEQAITQAPGRPTVAPASDKRPAIQPVEDDFEVLDKQV